MVYKRVMKKIIELKKDLYNNLLNTQIVLLKDLDKTVELAKTGKFYYWSFKGDYYNISNREILNFISILEEKEIYTVIPMFSINSTPLEPYIILSQQILCGRTVDPTILKNYLNEKIKQTFSLYEMSYLNDFHINLKFKKINFYI